MTAPHHKTLGIALQEKGLLVVEARPSGKETALHGGARMAAGDALPAGAGALAAQLRSFLRANDLRGRHAVLGVPARWLVCREMAVPPVEPVQLAGLLRIRAEREIAADVGRLAADYVRIQQAGAGGPVLLVAMLQEHVEQLRAMCREAGLKLDAVVPTVMVLAVAAPATGCQVVLDVGENAADVAILTDGAFRLVREVASTDAEELAGAVRRMLAPLGCSAGQVTVWGQAPEDLVNRLASRLGMQAVAGEAAVSVQPAGGAEARAFAGAAALALADSNPAARPVNFTGSRLAEVREFHLGRRAVWATALGLVLLIAAGATLWHWQGERREVAALSQRLASMKPQIDSATQLMDQVNQARGWYDRRPPFLDCLRALTMAFPQNGRIWTVSLRVSLVADPKTKVESMQCVVTGRSTDDALTLQLLNTLKGSAQFKDIKLVYLTGGQAAQQASSFAISFTFASSE